MFLRLAWAIFLRRSSLAGVFLYHLVGVIMQEAASMKSIIGSRIFIHLDAAAINDSFYIEPAMINSYAMSYLPSASFLPRPRMMRRRERRK